jgi:hypothetical protein
LLLKDFPHTTDGPFSNQFLNELFFRYMKILYGKEVVFSKKLKKQMARKADLTTSIRENSFRKRLFQSGLWTCRFT